jgi:hypothetical protein
VVNVIGLLRKGSDAIFANIAPHVGEKLRKNREPSQGRSSIKGLSHLQTPVFLGHGPEDPKVSVKLGERIIHVLLIGMGMDVT